MKIWLTAETRPSMCGGVRSVSSVERITTLTLSTIPLIRSRASESQNQRDTANAIQHAPNAATHRKSVGPALRSLR